MKPSHVAACASSQYGGQLPRITIPGEPDGSPLPLMASSLKSSRTIYSLVRVKRRKPDHLNWDWRWQGCIGDTTVANCLTELYVQHSEDLPQKPAILLESLGGGMLAQRTGMILAPPHFFKSFPYRIYFL